MDIFDTFFLVEYLRQWAARGRIVVSIKRGLRSSNTWWLTSLCTQVLTIHPPTYEIFTMISKVSIYISTQSYLHIYLYLPRWLSSPWAG